MKTRNSYIDLVKLGFAIVILLYHFNVPSFQGGYVVVEGFFIISGWLMMRAAERETSLPEAENCCRFMLRKYLSIFPYLLISALIGYFVNVHVQGLDKEMAKNVFPLLIFEVIPLQCAGFDGYWATGVSWYLSAMFISMLVLYPLAVKWKRKFSVTVAPFISVIFYGLLCKNYHHLDVPNFWIVDLFNSGLLRAAAGICLGAVSFEICKRFAEKPLGKVGKSVCSAVNLFCIVCVFLLIRECKHTYFDFVIVALLFVFLTIGLSQNSLLSAYLRVDFTKYLASFSTVIYLNHYYWSYFVREKLPHLTPTSSMLVYLAWFWGRAYQSISSFWRVNLRLKSGKSANEKQKK